MPAMLEPPAKEFTSISVAFGIASGLMLATSTQAPSSAEQYARVRQEIILILNRHGLILTVDFTSIYFIYMNGYSRFF